MSPAGIETIGNTIAALLTLCIFSFLYKDNVFYKLAEAVFVGTSAGYVGARILNDVGWKKLYEPLFNPAPGHPSDLWLIIPLILGVMIWFKLVPRYTWLARWPMAFIVGTGVGIMIISYFQSNAIRQVGATIEPFADFADMGWAAKINAILLAVGVVSGLIYFFFSKEHKGLIFGSCARIGIFFLMITFGASFGYTVMGRISLLIGRLQFLYHDWLHIM